MRHRLLARRISGGVFDHVNLDRLEKARVVQTDARFIAVGLHHQQKRVAQLPAALVQALALRDRSRNFLDPPEIAALRARLDDRVVSLLHDRHSLPKLALGGQELTKVSAQIYRTELGRGSRVEGRGWEYTRRAE